MIRLRTGTVRSVREVHPGLIEAMVETEGRDQRVLAYPALCGAVAEGATVLLNTTAVAERLGTGGYHFVVAVEGGTDLDPPSQGHVLKLRYTPLQAKVQAAAEQGAPGRDLLPEGLEGLPVAWVPLHSMVGAACAGARAAGAGRVAYAMTDGAALPVWLSRQVHTLREAGLLDVVVSCGQALGGDLEAVTLFDGLLVARGIGGADVVIVADGPGKVGTGTRWGATDVASGMAVNAAAILGGRPVAGLRLSFADPGYRHYGVSPHSLTVLREVALVPVHVAVPVLEEELRGSVWEALKDARLEERHQLIEVSGQPALELLRERQVPAETMGRTLDDDLPFFLAAGAAGVLAGRMAAGTAKWRGQAEASR